MVPRLDADPLVDALALHVPAGRVPVRPARRREPPPRPKLEPEFELVDTGVFDEGRYWEITADYAKASPEDILHPHLACGTRARRRRRSTCCRRCGSATPGRGTTTTRSRRSGSTSGALVAEHADARDAYRSPPHGSPEALFCDNETNAARLVGSATSRRRIRRTGSTTTSSTAPPRSTRRRPGRRPRSTTSSRSRAGETAVVELRLGDQDAGLGDDFARRAHRRGSGRPTSSTPS